MGDDRYPQSVKLHGSSPEGAATAALFCESLYFILIAESSLLYLNYCSSVQLEDYKLTQTCEHVVYFFLFVTVASKVDVSGAYESLPHNKLIEVVNRVLTPVLNEVFTIRRFAKIWADSHEGLKKAFIRQVKETQNENSFSYKLGI